MIIGVVMITFDQAIDKAYEKWLYEIEVYSMRIERIMADVNVDNMSLGESEKLDNWLAAAFRAGYESGMKADSND